MHFLFYIALYANSWRDQLSFFLPCKENGIPWFFFSHSNLNFSILLLFKQIPHFLYVKQTSETLWTPHYSFFHPPEMLQDFICCHFRMTPRLMTLTTWALRCGFILKIISAEWRYRANRWEWEPDICSWVLRAELCSHTPLPAYVLTETSVCMHTHTRTLNEPDRQAIIPPPRLP